MHIPIIANVKTPTGKCLVRSLQIGQEILVQGDDFFDEPYFLKVVHIDSYQKSFISNGFEITTLDGYSSFVHENKLAVCSNASNYIYWKIPSKVDKQDAIVFYSNGKILTKYLSKIKIPNLSVVDLLLEKKANIYLDNILIKC